MRFVCDLYFDYVNNIYLLFIGNYTEILRNHQENLKDKVIVFQIRTTSYIGVTLPLDVGLLIDGLHPSWVRERQLVIICLSQKLYFNFIINHYFATLYRHNILLWARNRMQLLHFWSSVKPSSNKQNREFRYFIQSRAFFTMVTLQVLRTNRAVNKTFRYFKWCKLS